MKKYLVLINGKSGSGKTTLVKNLQDISLERVNKDNSILIDYSNSKGVKDLLISELNWDGVKDDKGKRALIHLTNAGYTLDKYFWEKVTEKTLKESIEFYRDKLKEFDSIIVTIDDWRYFSTFEYFHLVSSFFDSIITVNISTKSPSYLSDDLQKDSSENLEFDNFNLKLYWDDFSDIDYIKVYNSIKSLIVKKELEAEETAKEGK